MSLSDLCLFAFANGSYATSTSNGNVIMQPDCTAATRTHRSGFLVSARVHLLNTSHHWYLSENHVSANSRSRRCMCSEKDRPAMLKWIEMASQKSGIRLFVTSHGRTWSAISKKHLVHGRSESIWIKRWSRVTSDDLARKWRITTLGMMRTGSMANPR